MLHVDSLVFEFQFRVNRQRYIKIGQGAQKKLRHIFENVVLFVNSGDDNLIG